MPQGQQNIDYFRPTQHEQKRLERKATEMTGNILILAHVAFRDCRIFSESRDKILLQGRLFANIAFKSTQRRQTNTRY
jgi:hypothetical protein